MSLIVAGRFTTFPEAEAAARQLFAYGFVEDDVTLFFVNPRGQHDRNPAGGDQYVDPAATLTSKGAGVGVTIGAVVGAAVGAALVLIFSAPLLVSVVAAGVGAYIGSLAGAMSRTRGGGVPGHRQTVPNQSRDSGVILAVHVSPDNQLDAARLLREAGGVAIERATGRWQDGRWSDFDPTKTPVPLNEP